MREAKRSLSLLEGCIALVAIVALVCGGVFVINRYGPYPLLGLGAVVLFWAFRSLFGRERHTQLDVLRVLQLDGGWMQLDDVYRAMLLKQNDPDTHYNVVPALDRGWLYGTLMALEIKGLIELLKQSDGIQSYVTYKLTEAGDSFCSKESLKRLRNTLKKS